MEWTRRKRGKAEIQKLAYLKNKKSFSSEIKSIFHNFWRTIIHRKKVNSRHKLSALTVSHIFQIIVTNRNCDFVTALDEEINNGNGQKRNN